MALQPKWHPAYPDAAVQERGDARTGPVADPDADTGGGDQEWAEAPDTSHCWGFRYFDARSHSFQRKFLGGVSILYVRFKPPANKPEKGVAEYAYEFPDAAAGLDVFEDLKASPHPYAEVVLPRLIRAGVPYYPTRRD